MNGAIQRERAINNNVSLTTFYSGFFSPFFKSKNFKIEFVNQGDCMKVLVNLFQ